MPGTTTGDRTRFASWFKRWFRARRLELTLSQSAAARLFETTENTIRAWEQGQIPEGYTLIRIFDEFGFPDSLEDKTSRVLLDGIFASFPRTGTDG